MRQGVQNRGEGPTCVARRPGPGEEPLDPGPSAAGRGAQSRGWARRPAPPSLPAHPSSVIWKCRKWDYPETDVHKRGEMESVTAGQPLITSDCSAVPARWGLGPSQSPAEAPH